MRMNKNCFLICCIIVFSSVKATAQNVSSPYSILGIGDIENNDYGRFSASGNAGVSRREIGFYNFSNPASLTVIPYKSVNLDFTTRGRSGIFKLTGTDTFTNPPKDFVVKRVALSFKVTPTVAFAVGLKPFSSVNYQYTGMAAIKNEGVDYIRYVDGSGGIYKTYFSIAKEIKRGLSVGVTTSWLFGSLKNSTEYYNPLIGLDVTKKEYKFYNAAGLQTGLQYYSKPGKKWQHTVGVTASLFTKLKGQNTTDYVENDSIIKSLEPENISMKLPVSFVAGYSIAKKSGLSLHVQGSYHQWPAQKLSYRTPTVKDAYGLNAGIEYSKKMDVAGYSIEKFYLACGVRMEQSYIVINHSALREYAFTLGAGKNISPLIGINASMEFGKRGQPSRNQIMENYLQYSIGITLKDLWYGTKKFGRYN